MNNEQVCCKLCLVNSTSERVGAVGFVLGRSRYAGYKGSITEELVSDAC